MSCWSREERLWQIAVKQFEKFPNFPRFMLHLNFKCNQLASHLWQGRVLRVLHGVPCQQSPEYLVFVEDGCELVSYNLVNIYNIGFQFKLKFAIKLLRSFYHCLTHLKTSATTQICWLPWDKIIEMNIEHCWLSNQ